MRRNIQLTKPEVLFFDKELLFCYIREQQHPSYIHISQRVARLTIYKRIAHELLDKDLRQANPKETSKPIYKEDNKRKSITDK